MIENALKARNLNDLELEIYARYQCGEKVDQIAAELKMAEEEIYEIIGLAIEKFPKDAARPLDY